MRNVRCVVALLAIVSISSVAPAQEFFDDFESYAPGSEMHGQGGWKGWDNTVAAGAPASDLYAYSGSVSVEIGGPSDLVHEFDIAGGRWLLTAMQLIPSGTTSENWFILLNTYNDGANATKDWSAQVNFRLAAGTLTSNEGGGELQIVYDEWVQLKFIIDLDNNTVDIYYNDEFLASHIWDNDNHGTLQCIDLWGNNASAIYYDDVKLERYYIYTAHEPSPADGATGVATPLLQWTAGDGAKFHNVYLGTSPDLTEADLVSPNTLFTMYYHLIPLDPGGTYYWRVDEITADGTVTTGDVWSFTMVPLTAYDPNPRDGDKWIATDVTLTWQRGLGAASHDVYIGTDRDAVANRDAAVFAGNTLVPSLTPDALAENTTYYWLVDELSTAGAKQEGDVWSFTTIGPGGGVKAEYYMGMTPGGNPIVTQIEDSIDHNWGSNEVAGGVSDNISARWTADLEIAVADTYTFVTTSDDGVRLWLDGERIINNWTDHGTTNNLSRPIYLEPGIYRLRMEWYENGGGAVAQLSWETPSMARQIIPAGPLQPPVKAMAVYPRPGDTDVPQDVILMWAAGDDAVRHDVYFGDDAEAVAGATTASAGVYRGRQDLEATSYSPGLLEWNKTYYWRIDEVNAADADSPWQGPVWSFTTADCIVVDNFESYDDDIDGGTAIFLNWIDGWENGTGSTVGYEVASDGTFSETSIVRSGRQSMPLDYNNVNAPYYSETDRTWNVPQDWTVNGVDTLVLYTRGKSTNDAESLYVVLEDSASNIGVVVHPDPGVVKVGQWTLWAIPLSDFSAAGVNVAAVKKMIIGLGDRNAPTPGGDGVLYIDDITVKAGPVTP